MEPPAGGDAKTLKDAKYAVLRSIDEPTPPTTFAASTTGICRSRASPPDSQTETFAALRLEVDNWRWAGVPFFIRTGKWMASKQTEVRLVFPTRPGSRSSPPTGAVPSRARS